MPKVLARVFKLLKVEYLSIFLSYLDFFFLFFCFLANKRADKNYISPCLI